MWSKTHHRDSHNCNLQMVYGQMCTEYQLFLLLAKFLLLKSETFECPIVAQLTWHLFVDTRTPETKVQTEVTFWVVPLVLSQNQSLNLLNLTLGGSSTSGRRIQGPRSSRIWCTCGPGVSEVGSEFWRTSSLECMGRGVGLREGSWVGKADMVLVGWSQRDWERGTGAA